MDGNNNNGRAEYARNRAPSRYSDPFKNKKDS